MARAIIHDPAIVFADEPTGNLDSKSSKQAMESLVSIHEKDESTIMMVSHDAYAASFCERILFIKDGKLSTEIHRGDNKQILFLFMIPFAVAVAHAGFAFSALQSMLAASVLWPSIIILSVFLIIHTINFLIIRRIYINKIATVM
ncbi:hypothetical protein [Halobacillus amylolyticus]|uniref:hypothetical protein n=1 Tax=Halobacillus amylolyticus TaxID=2932259 RepID=UPI0029625400|nr:hypothetical protein [Halobacillus amylolyticus]